MHTLSFIIEVPETKCSHCYLFRNLIKSQFLNTEVVEGTDEGRWFHKFYIKTDREPGTIMGLIEQACELFEIKMDHGVLC